MSLFISRCPGGLTIATGTKPQGTIATFPGLGKHLARIRRYLPPADNGVYDVSPLVALTAVSRCLQPLQRCELADAFRACLVIVDKQSVDHPATIEGYAHDIVGWGWRPWLFKVGLAKFKTGEYTYGYKLVKGTKSYWVQVDPYEAWKVCQLVVDRNTPPPPPSEESSSTGSD